jgi:hypothetical protein
MLFTPPPSDRTQVAVHKWRVTSVLDDGQILHDVVTIGANNTDPSIAAINVWKLYSQHGGLCVPGPARDCDFVPIRRVVHLRVEYDSEQQVN